MIGIFDSGLGGLSVLAAVARAIPGAELIYLADTAHVPYGARDDEFIRGRVLAIGDHLVQSGCNLLVVACNTATAAAIEALRKRYPDVPVVGVEPGIKPAAASSKTRHIAVLVTESTAKSERLARLIATHAATVRVSIEACPGWATRVEMLTMNSPEFAATVAARIAPLLAAGADRLVLGCTHYSFLAPIILSALGDQVELVDVAEAVARQAARIAGADTGGQTSGPMRLRLMATANPQRLRAALPALGLDWLAQQVIETQLASV